MVIVFATGTAASQENDFNAYPENVAAYLKRIYGEEQQSLVFREDYAGGFVQWQQDTRELLCQKIGLPKIGVSVGQYQPVVTLDAAEDLGSLAIAPAVRGLSADRVPDLHDRHGNRACRSQAIHCLLAGRTATGERVWDMQRLLDWASKRQDVDSRHVLILITHSQVSSVGPTSLTTRCRFGAEVE